MPFWASSQNAAEKIQLDRIERKLDLILSHLGLTFDGGPGTTGPLADEVRRLLAEGRKIEAIKAYRAATGVGLREAKDAVEAVERL